MTLTTSLRKTSYPLASHDRNRHIIGIALVVLLHLIVLYALIASRVIPITLPHNEPSIVVLREPPPPVRPVVETTSNDNSINSPNVSNVKIADTSLPDITIAPPAEQAAPVAPPSTRESAPAGNPEIAPVASSSGSTPVGVACPNWKTASADIPYPLPARRAGLEGEVIVQFSVGTDGGIVNPTIISSTNRLFNSAALNAIRQFRCAPQTQEVRVETAISYKLTN